MGTRCLTTVTDGNKEVLCLYRQFDGYPKGHGMELVKAFKGFRITNGIAGDATRTANGFGCLAAQIVANFKTEVGGFYIYAAETREVGEEFIYTLTAKEDPKSKTTRIWLIVTEGEVTFFGNPGTKPESMKWLYAGWLDDFLPEKCEMEHHNNAMA